MATNLFESATHSHQRVDCRCTTDGPVVFSGPFCPVTHRVDVDERRRGLAPHQSPEGVPKIGHPVGVQERVQRRIEVRQHDQGVHHPSRRVAVGAERLDAVERVQREPADHEDDDDREEGLRSADLAFGPVMMVMVMVIPMVQCVLTGRVARKVASQRVK